MNLTSAGLRRRLDTLPTAKLWGVADALDVDPERLPYVTDRMAPESPTLRQRLRGAILSELREEGKEVHMTDERFYLCCNCGGIAPADTYGMYMRDYDAPSGRRAVADGDQDAVLICPLCMWEHEDTDTNPGIHDGSREEVEQERRNLSDDPVWRDLWDSTLKEVGKVVTLGQQKKRKARMTTDSELRRLIACNAYAAYLNTLVGNPAPRVAEEGERTRNPRPGDVVLETSTRRWYVGDPGAALGVLLREVREPIYSREAFDTMHAEGEYWDNPDESYEILPLESVYYVRPLDGSVEEFRWHDASLIRVHSEPPRVS